MTVDLGDAVVLCEITWRSNHPVDTVDILVLPTNGPTVTAWTSDNREELPCGFELAGIVNDNIIDLENERN